MGTSWGPPAAVRPARPDRGGRGGSPQSQLGAGRGREGHRKQEGAEQLQVEVWKEKKELGSEAQGAPSLCPAAVAS